MTQYVYEIIGEPTAWAAHSGYGKRSYSKHTPAKTAAQWQLKIQHNGRPLIEGAVRVDFFFEMPIPKSMPKKIRKRIAEGEKVWFTKRPDGTNLRKLQEDALTGTVLFDDNIVVSGETQKYYARGEPKTIIVVQELTDAT